MNRTFSLSERIPFFRLMMALMAIISLLWLGYEFWRLLFQVGEMGAIDLKNRHAEVSCWIDGINPYRAKGTAMYPPASYPLLWPFLGWLNFNAARWLWALSSLLCLGGLVFLTQKYAPARTHTEKLFWVILPLAIYPTGATIGNGQLPVHILPALMAALLLISEKPHLLRDVSAGLLFLFALVKPTLSAPFFWILVFRPQRLRPALVAVTGYLLLTFASTAFLQGNAWQLMGDWIQTSLNGADFGTRQIEKSLTEESAAFSSGAHWLSLRINRYMSQMQLHGLSLPNALAGLLLLGIWTWFYRNIDLWILLGVTALFARFWTYHMWYDDLLILLPMMALYRIAGTERFSAKWRGTAFWLFALSLPLMMAPGGLYLFPPPWNTLYVLAQKLLWVSMAFFLIIAAEKARKMPATKSFPLPGDPQNRYIPAHEKSVLDHHSHP